MAHMSQAEKGSEWVRFMKKLKMSKDEVSSFISSLLWKAAPPRTGGLLAARRHLHPYPTRLANCSSALPNERGRPGQKERHGWAPAPGLPAEKTGAHTSTIGFWK